LVGDEHARFARDQLGAEIVWMAAQTWLERSIFQDVGEKWTEIGLKAVVTHDEFV
jgi:hypothetical protein